MQTHPRQDVFIRSMATRETLGGLARATVEAVAILDAAGYDKIIVETVGVESGRDRNRAKTADVCAVVLVPGMGDDVQTMKAGIMEIADVLVINKPIATACCEPERNCSPCSAGG